jgi:hypothetical protein
MAGRCRKSLKEGYLAAVKPTYGRWETTGGIGRGRCGKMAQAKPWPEIDFEGEVKKNQDSIRPGPEMRRQVPEDWKILKGLANLELRIYSLFITCSDAIRPS